MHVVWQTFDSFASAASITMSPAIHPSALPPEKLLRDCDVERKRGSGPGGQHRNKVETAIVIRHRVTGVSGEASERRSQAENHRVALFRLRVNLAIEVRSDRGETQPLSELWSSRVTSGKISVNSAHDDFPALLAEAMDWIALREGQLPEAAADLKCTTSQLIRFLKQEPAAFARVNADRKERGQRSLK